MHIHVFMSVAGYRNTRVPQSDIDMYANNLGWLGRLYTCIYVLQEQHSGCSKLSVSMAPLALQMSCNWYILHTAYMKVSFIESTVSYQRFHCILLALAKRGQN